MTQSSNVCCIRPGSIPSTAAKTALLAAQKRICEIRLFAPRNGGRQPLSRAALRRGWSACFEGAIGLACRRKKVPFSVRSRHRRGVDLCLGESGYFLQACLNLSLPGLEREVARALVDTAHGAFPYSKAVHATSMSSSPWSDTMNKQLGCAAAQSCCWLRQWPAPMKLR